MVSHIAVDQFNSWDSSINMSPPDQHMDLDILHEKKKFKVLLCCIWVSTVQLINCSMRYHHRLSGFISRAQNQPPSYREDIANRDGRYGRVELGKPDQFLQNFFIISLISRKCQVVYQMFLCSLKILGFDWCTIQPLAVNQKLRILIVIRFTQLGPIILRCACDVTTHVTSSCIWRHKRGSAPA